VADGEVFTGARGDKHARKLVRVWCEWADQAYAVEVRGTDQPEVTREEKPEMPEADLCVLKRTCRSTWTASSLKRALRIDCAACCVAIPIRQETPSGTSLRVLSTAAL